MALKNKKNSNSYIKEDIRDKLWSDRKKIIKLIGLIIVPFIYGFICTFAFWNPFQKFSDIPTAFLDSSPNECIKYDNSQPTAEYSDVTNQYNTQEACQMANKNSNSNISYSWTTAAKMVIDDLNDNYSDDINIKIAYDGSMGIKAKYIQTDDPDSFHTSTKYWMQISTSKSFNDDVFRFINSLYSINKVYPNNPGDIIYWEEAVSNNLRVLNGAQFDKDSITSDVKYQKTYFGPAPGNYKNHNLQLYFSYQNNYLSGYFINIFQQFLDGFSINLLPIAFSEYVSSDVSLSSEEKTQAQLPNDSRWSSLDKYKSVYLNSKFITICEDIAKDLNNKGIFAPWSARIINLSKDEKNIEKIFTNYKNITYRNTAGELIQDEVVPKEYFVNQFNKIVASKIIKNSIYNIYKPNIQGEEHNKYGFGLSQLFICVGLWVGTLVQTIVVSKRKINPNLGSVKNYISKLAICSFVSVLQATTLWISLIPIGFFILKWHLLTMLIWMLLCSWCFSMISLGIWFLVSDEIVARIWIIIILVFSISAGWGTFPSFLSNGFFNFITYLTPFRYAINAQGSIIYGLYFHLNTSIYLWKIFIDAIVLISFALIFIILGIFGSYKNDLIKHFGTYSVKKIKKAVIYLKLEEKYPLDKKINPIWFNNIANEDITLIKERIINTSKWIKLKHKLFSDVKERI